MNFNILLQLFIFIILFNFICYVHSAPSASSFGSSGKHKNPKFDKKVSYRKNKGGKHGDSDGNDDESKFIEEDITFFKYYLRM
jgi:hypothetical protein